MSSIDWRTLICDSIMAQRRTSKEILVGWFKLPTKAWCDFLVTDVMLEQSLLSIVGRWSTQTETKHGLPTGFFKDVQLFSLRRERWMEGNLLLSLQSGSAFPLVFSYKNSRPIARWLFHRCCWVSSSSSSSWKRRLLLVCTIQQTKMNDVGHIHCIRNVISVENTWWHGKWHYLRKWIWNGTKKEKYLRNELLPSYF